MAKKITFNPISNNFDYVNDTTKLEYDLSKKQSKDFDSVNGNLAIFDNNGQTTDSGKTIGKETISKNIYYVLRNINDDTQNVYCSEEPFSLRVGSVIYVDKECTTEYGKVSYYMSGTIRIDTDTSIFWAIDYEPKEFVSSKRVATESAVVNFLKKSDWNQNDETAADYIKNRTHYEFVEDYKMMYDDEYEEKIQEGKQFELQKVKTVTIDNNRYYYDTSLAPEERDEYQGEVTSIPLMARRSNGGGSNLTYFSPRISINGKTIDLTWVEKTLENVHVGSTITLDPPFDLILDEEIRVFYNFARQDWWICGNNCAYGEGFTWFISDYVDGSIYGGGQAHHQLNTYFIDPEVFGEAPYTIDIYFECEKEIKKIDIKFLPIEVPKFKTGDVVYRTSDNLFRLTSWEDYEANPTAYNPIGLVVDPIKRTFLFCELLDKYFATSDNIETYFGGYTSFEDGAETFERIVGLKGTSYAADIPAFYGIRNSSYSSGSIFYEKNNVAYVPSIEEWKIAKEHLCTAFYGDDDSYAGFMDRLIALKTGVTPSDTLFIGRTASGFRQLFYSQISTVVKTAQINGTLMNVAYNMNGVIPHWNNATDDYACCPVFGLYTEEEENNG